MSKTEITGHSRIDEHNWQAEHRIQRRIIHKKGKPWWKKLKESALMSVTDINHI